MSATLSLRLDYGRALLGDEPGAREVAEILARPCLAALERVSGRCKNRWSRHAPASAETIRTYLLDERFDAVSFDTRRGAELVASAEIETTPWLQRSVSPAIRLQSYLVIPYVDRELDALLAGACALAAALRTGAGFLALEPDYRSSRRAVLGSFRPKSRDGLSQSRQIARRARHWKSDYIATQVASIEWGTFLGAGHLAQLDLDTLRASDAFARVVVVTPDLVFLQLTADPRDDLSGEVEARLARARDVLSPVLMDLRDVNLD